MIHSNDRLRCNSCCHSALQSSQGQLKAATVLQQVPSFGIFGKDVSSVGLRHVLKCVVGMKISVTQQIFHS